MAEALKNRPPAKAVLAAHADKLKKPLRELAREVTGFSSTPALKRKGAQVITAEFRKLAPKFKQLGLDVVIHTAPALLRSEAVALPSPGPASISPTATATATAGAGAGKASKHSGDFDPVAAGLKLVETMKQAEGGAFTGGELRSLFGLSPAALHGRRAKHGVVFWRDAKHDFHYPKWQFTPAGALIHGIQEVLRIFKSTDEWRIMGYFLTPRRQLHGRTPLDLLRDGNAAEVTAHATLHESENSW